MSLVRLLEIGRSLKVIRNTQSRYCMRPENLLPKFGMADSAASYHSITADASSGNAGQSHRLGGSVPLALASGTATDLRWRKAQQALVKPINQTVGLIANALKFLRSMGAKVIEALKPKAIRLRAFVNRNSKLEKPELQEELSLDNVTVIRNDLSDADLQVIQVENSSKTSLAAQTAKADVSAMPVNSAWDRVKSRFLQVPVGYQDELGFHRGVIPAKKEVGWPPFW